MNNNNLHDESSLMRDDMAQVMYSNLGGGGGHALAGVRTGSDLSAHNIHGLVGGFHHNQYESILFYDEQLEEDGFDFETIEEFFLNPKRKPVRIAKEASKHNNLMPASTSAAQNVNQLSRIEMEDDDNDSDSSITENLTYQAL